MDYKKIFRSQKVRFLILKFLSFVPDSVMLRLQYRIKMGLKLNLDDPKRFTEKLQWYKIYHRDPLMGTCVDKYEVRKYIVSKGLENTLNKLYCVCSDPDEIDFAALPDRFVVKTTDGGGGENIFICRDKSSLNVEELKTKLRSWKDKKNVNPGREWAYTLIKESRYIVEEYLENEVNPEAGISDYKFFCFNGEPKVMYITKENSGLPGMDFFDMDFQHLDLCMEDAPAETMPEKPKQFEKMKAIAAKLSEGVAHLRVDFYIVQEQIYVGELTFFHGGGLTKVTPSEWSDRLSEWLVLPERK